VHREDVSGVDAQLDPIEGILAVLDEGSVTGTNKFGVLLALIDLAPSIEDPNGELSVWRIAEKLIEIHWDHALGLEGLGHPPLRQVSSRNRRNTTVILEILKLRDSVGFSYGFEVARTMMPEHVWANAVREVALGTAKNPLRLLQNLPGGPPPFLYAILPNLPARIRFQDGALEALVRYGPVIRDIVESRFVRFVTKINGLGVVEGEVERHLFSSTRHMPPLAMRGELWELQNGRCIYTGVPIGDPSMTGSKSSVDHVVPWSRVRLSAAENFVIASRSVNSAKNAVLLGAESLQAWISYLTKNGNEIAQIATAHGWPTDLNRVTSILIGEYRYARTSAPVWSASLGVHALGERGRVDALTSLKRLASDALSLRDDSQGY